MKVLSNTKGRIYIDKYPQNFVFIIGAMKSGTTSLFDILSQHPEICPSRIKEPDYFAEETDQASLKKYLALFDWDPGAHSIALEASVAYTKDPYISGVPDRIKKACLGEYRFVYMLRNPLTRIESHIRHGLYAGWGEPLEKGVPKDALSYSSYAMQIEKYLDFFPRDRIMLFTLEEFKEDPSKILNNLCSFLQINTNFQFNDIYSVRNSGDFFNTSRNVASITQSTFGQLISKNLIPAKLKKLLRKAITRFSRGNSKIERADWQLTPTVKNSILEYLAKDLIKLERDYGVDIQRYWNICSDKIDKIK